LIVSDCVSLVAAVPGDVFASIGTLAITGFGLLVVFGVWWFLVFVGGGLSSADEHGHGSGNGP
jgi:hypothetical protein